MERIQEFQKICYNRGREHTKVPSQVARLPVWSEATDGALQ